MSGTFFDTHNTLSCFFSRVIYRNVCVCVCVAIVYPKYSYVSLFTISAQSADPFYPRFLVAGGEIAANNQSNLRSASHLTRKRQDQKKEKRKTEIVSKPAIIIIVR